MPQSDIFKDLYERKFSRNKDKYFKRIAFIVIGSGILASTFLFGANLELTSLPFIVTCSSATVLCIASTISFVKQNRKLNQKYKQDVKRYEEQNEEKMKQNINSYEEKAYQKSINNEIVEKQEVDYSKKLLLTLRKTKNYR